jgi:hypothetical protein
MKCDLPTGDEARFAEKIIFADFFARAAAGSGTMVQGPRCVELELRRWRCKRQQHARSEAARGITPRSRCVGGLSSEWAIGKARHWAALFRDIRLTQKEPEKVATSSWLIGVATNCEP